MQEHRTEYLLVQVQEHSQELEYCFLLELEYLLVHQELGYHHLLLELECFQGLEQEYHLVRVYQVLVQVYRVMLVQEHCLKELIIIVNKKYCYNYPFV